MSLLAAIAGRHDRSPQRCPILDRATEVYAGIFSRRDHLENVPVIGSDAQQSGVLSPEIFRSPQSLK
jgi:hypothetical protein